MKKKIKEKVDSLGQKQLTFEEVNINEKVKKPKIPMYIETTYDCIERYRYVGIENWKESLFERDSSLNKCVISSTTGEEVESLKLPLLSEISAGSPIYMNEEYDEYFYVPRDVVSRAKDLFMLKVKGDSMIEAGIDDGDYVIIRRERQVSKKSIVAVEVEGHATLKRFEVQGNKLILIPENKNYSPMIVGADEARIIGSAVGIIKYRMG